MAKDPYRKIAESTPREAGKRFLAVLDVALHSARNEQAEGVQHALSLLRATMDAGQSPEIALSMTAIYHDIESMIGSGDFAEASRHLLELKSIWEARLRIEKM